MPVRQVLTVFVAVFSSACVTTSSYGDADLGASTMTVNPPSLPASGTDVATVTVVVKQHGRPLPGMTVKLQIDDCQLVQPHGPTDANGIAVANVMSNRPGLHSVQATVSAEGVSVPLSNVAQVQFTPITTSQLSPPAVAGAAGSLAVSVSTADAPFVGTVRFVSSDPQASLPGSYTFGPSVDGNAVFINGVTLHTAGAQTVSIVDAATGAVLQTQTFVVQPGSPSGLVITAQSGGALFAEGATALTAGMSLAVGVDAVDGFGNVATTYTGVVHWTATDPNATIPGDTRIGAANAGAAATAGSVTFTAAGVQALAVQDGAGLTGRAVFSVLGGPAVTLAIAMPSAGQAGVPMPITVTARDSYGNVATSYAGAVTPSAAGATFAPPTHDFTAADAGTYTFYATMTESSAVTASDGSGLAATQNPPSLLGAPAAVEVMLPQNVSAGVPTSAVLTVTDAYGNVASGFTGTLTLTSSDPSGVFPATVTFTAADRGSMALLGTITFVTAGAQTLGAGNAILAVSGVSAPTVVVPGTPMRLTLTLPAAATAGTAVDATVAVLDQHGNPTGAYTGTVAFNSNDLQGNLPAAYTFTSADGGTHTFVGGVMLKTSGPHFVQASDAASSFGATQQVVVSPAAPQTLSVSGIPNTAAGTASSVTVHALDTYGNTAASYTGTVHFSSSDPNAVLPNNYTFVSSNNGAQTFSLAVTFETAGSQSVTVSDIGVPSMTGTQGGISIQPAAANHLLVTGLSNNVTAGQVSSITITAQDPYGNTATGYAGTVHFTSTDSRATLPPDTSVVSSRTLSNSVTLVTAGLRSVTATDTSTPSITGSQTTTVQAAATLNAAASTFTAAPAAVPADNNTSSTLVVTAADVYGNGISGQSVSMSSTGSGITFSPTTGSTDANGRFISAVKGTRSAIGPQTLSATMGATVLQVPFLFRSFGYDVPYSVGNNPNIVAAADLNGDGKEDVVAANYGSNTVSVLLNQGGGMLAAHVAYAVGTNPDGVALADVNGDGAADIVAANYGSNTVSVLLNQGSGTFGSQVTYAAGTSPHGVALADVNGDGKADIVAANSGSATVSVLLNQGSGMFGTQTPCSTGSNPHGVALADVSGDGKADIVTTNSGTTTVSVLINQGSGTFASQVTYTVGSNPDGVALADVNGDGHADIVAANNGSNTVSLLLNQGSGAFAAQVTYAVGNSPSAVAVADVSGDGKADIVAADSNSNKTIVLLNQGSGTFATQVPYSLGIDPVGVALADIDGDGKVDIVATSNSNNTVSVLRNQGSGLFGVESGYTVGNPQRIAAGDLNGDGVADIVAANNNGSTVSVLLNQGSGTFATQVTYAVGNNPVDVTLADVNGDGKADIITANYNSNTVSILRNQGNGTFAAQVTYTVGTFPWGVSAADVNNDGKLDIAVSNLASDNVGILMNQGSGAFAAQVTYSVGVNPCGVELADVTGDGKPDIIAVNAGAATASVLFNQGTGTFAAQTTYNLGGRPWGVSVTDVNADGKADIVAPNASTLGVLLNNGGGTFAAQVSYNVGVSPMGVSVADVNGDGKPDIATNNGTNTVGVLLNQGSGAFGSMVTYAVGYGNCGVILADVNADAKVDLLSADYTGGTVTVLLNERN